MAATDAAISAQCGERKLGNMVELSRTSRAFSLAKLWTSPYTPCCETLIKNDVDYRDGWSLDDEDGRSRPCQACARPDPQQLTHRQAQRCTE